MNISNSIRAEFARRALIFHPNEEVENIRLWGLFSWGTISKYLKDGSIILNDGYTKSNKTVWCRPSQNEIDNYIKPMMKKYSLEELTSLAGFGKITY